MQNCEFGVKINMFWKLMYFKMFVDKIQKTWSFDAVLMSENYKHPSLKHKNLLHHLMIDTCFGNFCNTCPNLSNCVGEVLMIKDLSLYFLVHCTNSISKFIVIFIPPPPPPPPPPIELSLGGSSPYSSTEKTNNKCS